MKKLFTILIATFVAQTSFSQLADFENLTFPSGKNYWKGNTGVAGNTSFQSGNFSFRNQNDTSSWGDYWSGWAYSKGKDSITTSYDTSDCNAFPAIGFSASNNYAVAYQSFDDLNNHIGINGYPGSTLAGLFITNSTITYRSMQNGGLFGAKKFGGATGNDADFLKVRFMGWHNGMPINDTVDFYLADFRDANNANDYIIKDWTFVNLTKLGNADSLTYKLESSDVGGFGMNTPAYFCVDNIIMTPSTISIKDISQNTSIKIYPNPINNEFQIANTSTEAMKLSILNLNGQLVFEDKLIGNNSMKINSENWSKGVYVIKIQQGQNQFYQKIIK
jgi:hypothetical protein